MSKCRIPLIHIYIFFVEYYYLHNNFFCIQIYNFLNIKIYLWNDIFYNLNYFLYKAPHILDNQNDIFHIYNYYYMLNLNNLDNICIPIHTYNLSKYNHKHNPHFLYLFSFYIYSNHLHNLEKYNYLIY